MSALVFYRETKELSRPVVNLSLKMERVEGLDYVNNDEDLTFASDNDQYTDDEGSDCSCSTCSTCSTCEMCHAEETGELSYDEEESDSPGCEHDLPNDIHYFNSDSDNMEKLTHLQGDELHFSSKNGFTTADQLIFEKFANVVVLKADASQFKNGGYFTNGDNSQEILLGSKQRKKKVTFLDSSSSSDEITQAEAYSISSLSDSSTSGSYPDYAQPLQNGDHYDKKIEKDQDEGQKYNLSEGEMEREYHRLRSVLKTIDPLKLHAILKHSLKTKDPETINALGTLLPKNKFTADTVHCVRCHKEYDPHYGRKRCTLYHPEKDVCKISQNSQGADFKCGLCSSLFTLQGVWDYRLSSVTEQNVGICFDGVHTPDPDEVSYQPAGAAQCCEDKGCIEFYV